MKNGSVMTKGKVDEEKLAKKLMKRWYKVDHARSDAWADRGAGVASLTRKSRIYCGKDDWESYTEYGFLRGTDYTDEELNEIREEMRLRVTSPYDCSGQRFTMWLTFHRNPSGLISYIHRIGIDV